MRKKVKPVYQCTTRPEYELRIFLEAFGEALFWRRNDHWLTQAELAKKIGITQAIICDIENANRDFQISFILRIATFFKMDPSKCIPTLEEMRRSAFIRGGWGIKRDGNGLLNPDKISLSTQARLAHRSFETNPRICSKCLKAETAEMGQ